MKVEKTPTQQAIGHILLHNQSGPKGQKILKKGQRLTEGDAETLHAMGKSAVYVAKLSDDDVAENEAAECLGQWLASEHLAVSKAATGRVNLIAATAGVFKVNIEALLALNDIPGVTLATLHNHSVVKPKKIVGTIKIIPFSIPQQDLETAHRVIINQPGLVTLEPFVSKQVVLITTGSEAAREKVVAGFTPALRERFKNYGSELITGPYVAEDETAICQALASVLNNQPDMVIIAGETSIMDLEDITPRAIKAVGGKIIYHGVPVEPGNLLLLAYHHQTPIVGAPGCAKSKHFNVVDMVLPRLATGERLSRQDLITLGHGGYLL